MAYRPHQTIIKALFDFFNAEPWSIPSNFPALARRIEYLQQLQPGCPPDVPVYACEAPQERDIDLHVQYRKVARALARMPARQRDVIEAAYRPSAADERLEKALTPILVGLVEFSRLQPERHMNSFAILSAVRTELDGIWRDAHRAFEKAYQSC